ncbi:MAG: tRNA preQ1(34) S-adenosylmethionine ribosyltransferase-isomerase QueA [Clostridiales bacterium]|nr:tRNA preQ1(34) S-adenosylmethionine ribosyltransferase-isomerase QueA [Clostridiales bacterium]
MNTKEFYYHLPPSLIAQTPPERRELSRLMLLDKDTGAARHEAFANFADYLNPGDCLVLNDTRVIPARLCGVKEDTGAAIEFLLLRRIAGDVWEVMAKPGKRVKPGARVVFGDGELVGEVTEAAADGNRLVKFEYAGIFQNVLEKLGEMPLPPYITEKQSDRERYQTVYSRSEGSVAAPTAGLHFTNAMLDGIRSKGVKTAFLTLHVGQGTFLPVKTDIVEQHKMHAEFYTVDEAAANAVNETRQNGGSVIAVGTTSARTLETAAGEDGRVRAGFGWTDIFIYPPYRFRAVDRLLTNFHLPESTLLMLVSALAGRENVLNAYGEAVREGYRFFSFGDCMLIG